MESTSTSSSARNRGRLGVLALPFFEAGQRGFLSGEFATTTSGIFVARLLRGGLGARGRHPRRFALHLAKVRRPGRVAQTRGFVSAPQAPAAFRANRRRLVHAGVRIAEFREALGHREHREIGRLAVGDLVPMSSGVDTRASGSGRTEYAEQWCDPSRSGCSRGTRRAAPLSTISSWPAPARAARRRAISAMAARRTSANVQRGSIRTFTCIPREPLVLGQPRSPISSSSAFTSSATRARPPTRRRGPDRDPPAVRPDGPDRPSAPGAGAARCSPG
jgi:hypothetical protein